MRTADAPASDSYFVVARSLRNCEIKDVRHEVGRGTEFRVVDARTVVLDEGSRLLREVRRLEAILAQLSSTDARARKEPIEDLETTKATLAFVQKAAGRLGVRLRG